MKEQLSGGEMFLAVSLILPVPQQNPEGTRAKVRAVLDIVKKDDPIGAEAIKVVYLEGELKCDVARKFGISVAELEKWLDPAMRAFCSHARVASSA